MKRYVAFVLLSWATTLVSADSLYTPQSPLTRLFSDQRAAQVGDVLQVLIMETVQANQTAKVQTANKSEAAMGPGQGWLDFLPLFGYKGDISSTASGTATHAGSLTGRLTVVVTGITPQGNLRIEGTHIIRVNKEAQTITLRGEVRPQDIGPDNTVPSYRVANAEISYSGPNPRRPRSSQVGILTGLLHWLF